MKREMGAEPGVVDAAALASSGGHMFRRTTRQITVSVEPAYLADQSAPDSNHFFWAYTVLIENGSPDTVQLRARYWRIIDANGRTIEVKGAGVVGQQPILRPGETFEYKSGTPLETPSGMMLGAYQMQTADGETFQVDIPVFPLDSPHEARVMH
jgi:ApaG protein